MIPGSAAGPGGTAYVRELPAGPQTVACAATPAPVPGVRIWRANAPYGPVGTHGDAAAGAGSA